MLVNHLKPLLERYRVQAYLNGHSHALEHIVVGGVHYVTSRRGRAARRQAIAGTRFVAGERLGFAVARIAADTLAIEFVDAFGAVLYRAAIELAPVALPVGAR